MLRTGRAFPDSAGTIQAPIRVLFLGLESKTLVSSKAQRVKDPTRSPKLSPMLGIKSRMYRADHTCEDQPFAFDAAGILSTPM
jgi:hypothetical protein